LNLLLNKLTQLPANRLIWLLTAIGVLIAMQINYIQHGWINNDSVLYFEAARLFAAGEWKAGFQLFPWPLYSGLIATTHQLFGLDIHLSAQVLNVLFFGIATASFLKLIQLAGGDQLTLLSGSLILFSSQYVVGDVLQMLMRDQGFWAFFLTSLVFFTRFYRLNQLSDALLWQIFALIAMLFRIEGVSYLIGLPLILLLKTEQKLSARIYAVFLTNCINLILAISVASYLVLNNLSMKSLGRLQEVFSLNLYEQLSKNFIERSEIMASQVLGNYLDDFAIQALLLSFTFIMIAKTVSTAGLINIGFAILSVTKRKILLNENAWIVIRATILIAGINMFLIIFKVFVLSGRYIVALAFMVMILAAFGLRHCYKYFRPSSPDNQLKKWVLILVMSIMALGFVKNILPKKAGYNYEQDAVSWIKENNPDNLPVYYDDARARHYAKEAFIGTWPDNRKKLNADIENQSIDEYGYLLVSMSKSDMAHKPDLEHNLSGFVEVAKFTSVSGKKFILVYKNQLLEKNSWPLK